MSASQLAIRSGTPTPSPKSHDREELMHVLLWGSRELLETILDKSLSDDTAVAAALLMKNEGINYLQQVIEELYGPDILYADLN